MCSPSWRVGKIFSKAFDTISHKPLATWVYFIFAFCWQALKEVLIRGLLILLRRSIQPSAQKRVTSLAVAYGCCGTTAARAAAITITRLGCCSSLAVKPSARLLSPSLAHCFFGKQQRGCLSAGGTVCLLFQPSIFFCVGKLRNSDLTWRCCCYMYFKATW